MTKRHAELASDEWIGKKSAVRTPQMDRQHRPKNMTERRIEHDVFSQEAKRSASPLTRSRNNQSYEIWVPREDTGNIPAEMSVTKSHVFNVIERAWNEGVAVPDVTVAPSQNLIDSSDLCDANAGRRAAPQTCQAK